MLDGLLFALLAAVLFGIQYVPVKTYKIHDGTTFQWFMCSGILFVGLIGGLLGNELDHGLPLPVVFGGALWALSNFLVLPVVKLLGIGLGFSLYHFVNLIVGYVVGRNGVFGVPSLKAAFEGSLYFCDFGCGLILISFVVMLLVEWQPKSQQSSDATPNGPQPPPTVHGNAQEQPPPPHANGNGHEDVWPMDKSLLVASGTSVFALGLDEGSDGDGDDGHCPGRGVEPAREDCEAGAGSSSPAATSSRTMVLGVSLAVVAGGLTGVQSVPATLYSHAHPDYPSTAVVLPQCVGVWFASTSIYVLYSGVARLRRKPVRHAVIRPAFLSGCFWALGFSCMMKGIRALGFAVGYTLDAVGPILVASLISICWFKEIAGRRQLCIYWSAEALQCVGVMLITIFSTNDE